MKLRSMFPFALVVALLGAASATAAAPRGAVYTFRGELRSASATSVAITVEGGDRLALKAMLGQPVDQTFTAAASTEFLQWSKGVPTVVQPGDLAAGDWVDVSVRAPRGASLAQIESAPVAVVGDHGARQAPPDQPLYLFRGTISAVGTGSVSVDVRGGNRRALRLLVGRPAAQSFATGPETIFLLWQGKVPTVISASQLQSGDSVTVRIRAEARATLAEVEATAAVHVGEHEPADAAL